MNKAAKALHDSSKNYLYTHPQTNIAQAITQSSHCLLPASRFKRFTNPSQELLRNQLCKIIRGIPYPYCHHPHQKEKPFPETPNPPKTQKQPPQKTQANETNTTPQSLQDSPHLDTTKTNKTRNLYNQ
jgi:hypothetical protein